MLSVGGLVRCRVLQPRARELLGRWATPSLTCTTESRVRTASGVGGANGAGGWYGSLSDSAPVHLCENFLVSVHQVSGLPWWLSIAMATVSVRTFITLPLAAYQLIIIAKVEALQVEISELAKRLRYEVSVRGRERGWKEKESRVQFQKNLRRLVSQLYIRDNCHPFKASLLVWVQLPLWVSLSLALRNLSLDHSALQGELAAGGALWFSDLTVPDSTWILPVFLGLTNLLILEVFALQRVRASSFQRLVLNGFRGFSVLMIPIAASVPSSMALYWFCSSLVGFSHNLLLRSPTVHRTFRLPAQRSKTPYRDLLLSFINNRKFGLFRSGISSGCEAELTDSSTLPRIQIRVQSRSHLSVMKSRRLSSFLVPLLFLLPVLWAGPGCAPCDPAQCAPLPAEGCPAGSLRDSCGCCAVCAAAEGELCGGRRGAARRCGSGLECVRSDDDKKSKTGVCACKSNYEVCGTDGTTYKSACALKTASRSEGKEPINIQNKGRCASAPVIVTPPGQVYNVSGSQVYLSCEAVGVPTPVLTWKKILGGKRKAELLPGDRDNLAIQTRGGPEKHQVTGWVLISPLTEEEEGSYECHAANSKGEASAIGAIHLVDSIYDIIVKAGMKEAEL
ncbi:hypothetical protein ATANTOWER_008118 [Ataeniobius toweri]|uniref:Uncharacterized protein n=1 Tax=Ataeniobius toweri TaxID=208326 RepID=A0ABU7A515_9TELE|nr:hypothetical protein [Ataeniobius toweri]